MRGRRAPARLGVALGAVLSCTVATAGCSPSPPGPGPGVSGPVLVAADAAWRHTVQRPEGGDSWAAPDLDDASWARGQAPLGYGERSLATYTEDPTGEVPPHLTVYFRTGFDLAEIGVPRDAIEGLSVRYQRDDGLRLLLNGVEILRHDLPGGAIGPETRAPRSVGGEDEARWHRLALPPDALRPGANLVAAEVHQVAARSGDLRFALELRAHRASDPTSILRGPYLQQTSRTRTVLCYGTDRPALTWVELRSSLGVTVRVTEEDPTRHHEVELALPPDGDLSYRIGVGDRVLVGMDTPVSLARPLPGRPVRAWVTGDQGSGDEHARAVLEGMRRAAGDRPPELWITLGDNAYPSGSEAELQSAVFDTFAPLLRSATFWPAPGNHDLVLSRSQTDEGPYFDAFSLPTRGEAGGEPSGRERWYAFDWGPLHVVSLDTVTGHRRPEGPMLDWLRRDLARARERRPWLIAAFHHPPYSRGSHDSAEEVATGLVRERVVPILEEAGVHLVLAGHSHGYERSRLGEGPVYVVSGHGSIPGTGPLDHPRMEVSRGGGLGSLLLDADADRLRVRAIDDEGRVFDEFERLRPADPAPRPGRELP